VSRDWFDPFGIRGSRLDPFVIFTNALKGQGPAGQSAEFVSTAIARRIVGRTVHVDAGMQITATIEAIDEARPPAPLAALPTGAAEVPMWERVRVRLHSISVGDRRIEHASVDAHDIRLVGVNAQAMRVAATGFSATIRSDEVERWAGEIEGDHRVRVHAGRLEVTDRRLQRWIWVEVDMVAREQRLFVSPMSLRAFGRSLPLPGWLRRTIERPAVWLPAALRVERVEVRHDEVLVTGAVANSVVPVDVGRVLADLGSESTMSALRIVSRVR
jgi:hypothetical protein